MLKKHKWTTKDITKLLQMKKKGKSLKKISENFQVSINAISKALGRYSISHVKIPKKENNSYNPISDALEWCKQKNIPIKKKEGSFFFKNKIISYVDFIIIFNKFRVNYNESIVRFPSSSFFFEDN
ncbi:hypothetical protein AB836_02115 [Rickettsiales bacterium (ex Bugula neritina AB1)]|nr:hypothetical protein AB836_02115 [Rickettsiales bacterium (ex Bugula neritina AB1)]